MGARPFLNGNAHDEVGEGAGRCQVCGESVTTEAVRCARCDTVHHLNCFVYNQECSVYACRSTACVDIATGRTLEIGRRRALRDARPGDGGPPPPGALPDKPSPVAGAKGAPPAKGDAAAGPQRGGLVSLDALAPSPSAQKPHAFLITLGIVALLLFLFNHRRLGRLLGGRRSRPYRVRGRRAASMAHPLHRAIREGDLLRVRHLLGGKPGLGDLDREGDTPVHAALRAKNPTILRLLLARGAPVDLCDRRGLSPLHLAVELVRPDLAAALLKAGATVDARDGGGYTPLHVAAETGIVAMTRLLLDRGAAVNAAAGNGDTPLHLAAATGDRDLLALLLSRGADPRRKNRSGETPGDRVRAGSDKEILSLMEILAPREGGR